ncbi:MAG: VOC family protein [Acetobacteraceae bacterium]
MSAMAFTWDHLHLRSRDPERAAAFYVTMFGATRHPSIQSNGNLRCIVELDGQKLFLEQVPEGTHAAPEPPYVGLEHIGLTVSGIDAVATELKRRGAEFVVEPKTVRPGVRIAFVRGPDDVRIELIERGA